MEQESVAVGAEHKGHLKHLCVAQGLLHAVTDRVVVVFSFDNGYENIRLVEQDIISTFALLPGVHLSLHDNPPFGERKLFPDLGRDIPARPLQRGCYVLCADVALGELFFLHQARFPSSLIRSQKSSNRLLANLKGTVLLFSRRLIVEKLTHNS